ncbi:hypothetical protein BH11VER1_BH11VER1_25340 [soil metagenome]
MRAKNFTKRVSRNKSEKPSGKISPLNFVRLEDRILYSATPVATLDAPAEVVEHHDPADSGDASHEVAVAPSASSEVVEAAHTEAEHHDQSATGDASHETTVAPSASSEVVAAAHAEADHHADESPAVALENIFAPAAGSVPSRMELLFVDGTIHDAEALAQSLIASAPEGSHFQIITLDPSRDGLTQITESLALHSTPQHGVDAIHLVTHADSGKLLLGSAAITQDQLGDNSSTTAKLSAWKPYLSENADILLYGCDVAEGQIGLQYINRLSEITGADVAASTDITGAAHLGGNWVLEAHTGLIEASSLSSAESILLVPVATITVDAPENPFVGEAFDVAISFSNTSPTPTDAGYGPFVELRVSPGVDVVGGFTYLGQPVAVLGSYVNNTALPTVIPHPIPQLAGPPLNATITLAPGEEYYILQLPFGSFVPGQPTAVIDFQAISDKLEAPTSFTPTLTGTQGTVSFQVGGGYIYGADPLNNPLTDTPIYIAPVANNEDGNPATGAAGTDEIQPRVWEVSKDLVEKDDEAATGPNDPQIWRIVVDVANGETLTSINIDDFLSNNLVYVAGSATISSGGITYTPVSNQPNNAVDLRNNATGALGSDGINDNAFRFTIPTFTGTISSSDIVITYQTYVPFLNANGVPVTVLSQTTGDDVSIVNGVNATGTYDPDGAGGPVLPATLSDTVADPHLLPNFDTLSAESLTIQKSVTDLNGGGLVPGDALAWNLDFQVSDYFQFNDLYVIDRLSDGQLFINASGTVVAGVVAPTFTWSENGTTINTTFSIATPSADLNALANVAEINFGNFVAFYNGTTSIQTFNGSIYEPSASSAISVDPGETILLFRISEQMVTAGADGTLQGDGLPAGGLLSAGTLTQLNTALAANIGNGQTNGRIVFRSIVQENYITGVSGDISIDMGDSIGNSVDINGQILNNVTGAAAQREGDDSSAGLVIDGPALSKSIFAVQGNTSFSNAIIGSGETITWKLNTTLSIADVENLVITDFVPLPKFIVTDFVGTGSAVDILSDVTVYNRTTFNGLGPAQVPPAGKVFVVLGDDVYTALGGNIVSATSNSNTNSFIISVGTFDLDGAAASLLSNRLIDVYFTLAATDQPMADGLFLTNQQQTSYNDTGTVSAVGEAIAQVKIKEPVVDIQKGIVASTLGGGLTLGGIVFNGVAGTGFTGIVSDQAEANAIGASNLTTGLLPDAGDTIRYAVVVQNTGRGDAHDVTFSDTLNLNYFFDANPADETAFIAATGFKVFTGAGVLLTNDTHYTLTYTAGTGKFEVELIDIASTTGRLAEGKNPDGSDITTGLNTIVVTYDVVLQSLVPSVPASLTYTNTASLSRYTGMEGGIDRLPVDDTETAVFRTAAPLFTKVLTSSEINATGNNGTNQAVIGELVTYTLTITVPEGTTPNTQIVDRLAPGLAFVDITSVSTSPGLTVATPTGTGTGASAGVGPTNVAIGNTSGGTANQLTFSLGDITNTNVDNAVTETITIVYRAVVVNTNAIPSSPGNQAGSSLGNTADFTYTTTTTDGVLPPVTGSNLINSVSANVAVVEPSLAIAKGVVVNGAGTVGDAGDSIVYTITITNAAGSPGAFDLTLQDILPRVTPGSNSISYIDTPSISSVSGVSGLTAANFALTGSNANGWILTANAGQVDIPSGNVLQIQITGTLATAVAPNLTLTNDVDVTWSSLDGAPGQRSIHNASSTERDGSSFTLGSITGNQTASGSLNNYANSAVVNSTITASVLTKTLVRTSESFTADSVTGSGANAGWRVAVGEIVRYRLVASIPEGTSPDLHLLDRLPPGLVFINDSTAMVGFLSAVAGQAISDTITDVAAYFVGTDPSVVTPTHVLADAAVSSNRTSNLDNYDSDTDIYFKLGTITNTNATNAQLEYVIIEFNALVLNTSSTGNQAGTVRNNDFQYSVNGAGANNLIGTSAQSSANRVIIAEPNLAVLKAASTAGPVDAGDLFSYTITITNNANTAFVGNAAPAFDIRVLDEVDKIIAVTNPTAELEYLSYALTVPGYTTTLSDASDTGTDILDLTFNRLNAGDSIIITVNVQVKTGAIAGAEIENKAVVTYTSLPGASGTDSGAIAATYGTTDVDLNPGTDSILANADANNGTITLGLNAGERTGVDSEATANDNTPPGFNNVRNNYAVAANAPAGLIIRIPTIDKSFKDGSITADDTSSGSTSGSNVVIGETVTYDILVTLSEGVVTNLRVEDIIPVGLRIDSYTIITDGSALLAPTAFNGSFTTTPTLGAAVNGASTLTLDFDDVTVNADGVTTNNSFVIRVVATVTNIALNQQAITRTNTARLLFNDPDGAVNAGPAADRIITDANTGNDPLVTVVEPQLSITKTADAAAADAGDPITYTITITNTSPYFAYDVDLSDTLSSLLLTPVILNGVGDFSATGFTTAPTTADFEITGGNILQSTAVSNIDMDPGATIVIKVQGILSNSVSSGQSITNTATATFTSLDDDAVDGNDADERTGADGVGGALNDYAVASTVVTTAVNNPSIVKALVSTNQTDTLGSNVAIGEQVTYTLTVTLAEGLSQSFSILDIAQDNANGVLEILSAQITSIGANITNTAGLIVGNTGTLSSPGTSALNNQAAFSFGDVTNIADNINNANDQITITVTARVANQTVNQSGDVLSNTGRVTYGPGGATTLNSTTVNVTVVEPDLNVVKTITSSTANIDAGDTVTYQIVVSHTGLSNSNAYDIILADTMPGVLQNYTLVSAVITDGNVPSNIDVASRLNLTAAGVLSTTGDIDLLLDTNGTTDQSLTITITAQVKDATNVGTSFTNTVDIDWSSLNGGLDGDDAGTIGERTGGGSNPPNDYSDSDSVTAATVGTLAVSKAVDLANAPIGQVVTYTVTVTVAEGRTVINLADTLPSGVTLVANSAALTTPAGWTITGFTNNSATQTLTIINPGASGGTTNDAATLDTDTFTYTYQAVVRNILANQNGTTLINDLDASADLNNDGDTGDAGETDNNNIATVTVIEPRVTIDKVAAPTTGLNAGDVVTYTVVLDNLAINGATSTAFDTLLSDTVPSGILITGITTTTLAGGASIDSAIAITGGGTGLAGQFDIPVGGKVTIVYTATIQTSIIPGQTLVNDADATFTSLNGVNGGERTGADITEPTDNTHPTNGLLNNYGVGDTVTVTALSYAPLVTKSIVSTSEAGSTGNDVLVGEIVRYQLKFELFEGTLNDLVIRDLLPAELQFLNDGTATFTTQNVTTTVTGVNLLARDSVTGNGTTFGNGTDIFFQLGDVVNNDNDADVEYGVIEFNALVLNTTPNQEAATRDNSFAVMYDADNNAGTAPTAINTLRVDANDDGTPETTGQSVSNTVTVTLREAVISFSETIPAGVGYDAGDTFTITYTITNSGSVPAYNVRLADLVLPAEFNLTAITFTNTGTGGTVTDSTNLGTDSIDSEISQIAAGSTWTVSATVTLRDTVNPSDVYTNPADVSFTSLPGANGTTSNVTGSNTPGLAGSATGERTGADGVGGALNDYALTSSAGLSIPNPFIVGKVANVSTATIGDIVTYTVTVTVIEGTTTNIVLNDTLPTGMSFVANSAVLTDANGMTISGFNTNSLDQALTSVLNPGASDSTGTAATDTFTYTYQALVQNVVSNQKGTTLVNDLDASGDGVPPDNNNTATVTVIEPDLNVAKTITSSTANIDAGDTVTYQIVVSHTAGSDSNAYDIILADTMPGVLENYMLVSALITDGNLSNNLIVTGRFDLTTAGILSTTGDVDLFLNTNGTNDQVLTITITATVKDATNVGTSFTNTVDIDWSSLNGGLDGDDAGTINERTGGGSNPPNDYSDSDNVTAATVGTLNVSKVANVANATIGDIITYTVSVTVAEGRTVVNLADTLPLGVSLVANSAVIATNPSGMTITGFNVNSATQTLTIVNQGGSGSTTNDAATLESDTFTYTYQVLVLDVASNDGVTAAGDGDGQTSLINDVDSSADLNNDGDTTDPGETDNNNQATVVVIEPKLIITKVNDDADKIISPGQIITYTLTIDNLAANGSTATAYDIRVRDILPSTLTLTVSSISVSGATLTNNSSAVNTIDLTLDNLALGSSATVTFTATVSMSVSGGSTIDNNAKIFYDGQATDEGTTPGTGNTVFGDTDGTSGDRDYGSTGPDEFHSFNTPDEQDTDRVRVGTGLISDQVWFDLDADGVKDITEIGIVGVQVWLDYNNDGVVDANEPTDITDADGLYSIGNLAAGTYTVRVLTSTLPDAATTVQTYDIDSIGTPSVSTVSLTNGQVRTDVDFGYRGTGSIGDLVWHDIDGNAIQNGIELGIMGVTLDLVWDVNGNGVIDGTDSVISTVTTDALGNYLFTNLLSGNYIVNVTDTANLLASTTLTGATGVTDPEPVNLGVGENHLTADFGYQGAASLGDRVWNDRDADGVQDSGEFGIVGLTVELYRDLNGDGDATDPGEGLVATTTTGTDGAYLFSNLISGTYYALIPTPPTSSTQTFDLDDGFDLTPATPHQAIRTLLGNTAATDVDFGYQGSASIGDFVWYDANNDGVQDGIATEPAIPNVRVYLDINGDDVYDSLTEPSAITDANGLYSITGLVGGTYTAHIDISTLPAGYVATYDLDGNGSADVTTFVLGDTENKTDVDFGYIGTLTVSGRSYHDLLKNGDFDGADTGLGGVTIELIFDTNNDGMVDAGDSLVFTTTTAADGTYSFDKVISGNYLIRETQLAGYGSSEALTNLIDITVSGADVTDNDFGNTTGSIAGHVYLDSNDDGLVDLDGVDNILGNEDDEISLEGVSVTLTWSGGDGIFGTADDRTVTVLTNANGDYRFDYTNTVGFVGNGNSTRGLLSTGSYRIAETQPEDYLDGVDTQGDGSVLPGSVTPGSGLLGRGADEITDIQIGIAQDAAGYNFGELLPSSISGSVHEDFNRNGIRELTEPGIAGSIIMLTGKDIYGRTVSLTTTTDANGNFKFEDLYASDATGYTLSQLVQPPGFRDGLEGAGTAGGSANVEFISSIVLGYNEDATDYTFGEVRIPPPVKIKPKVDLEPEPELTVLDTYFYNFFDNFLPYGQDDEDKLDYLLDPPKEGIEPMLPIMPMYSGHAEPGSTIVVEIRNIRGVTIGTETVMADAGGNWLAKFASNVVYDTPTKVTYTVTRPTYSEGSENAFNMRTFFSPAINPSHFFSEKYDVNTVLSEAAANRMEIMQKGNEGSQSFDWNSFNYEFLAEPGVPSS